MNYGNKLIGSVTECLLFNQVMTSKQKCTNFRTILEALRVLLIKGIQTL